MVASTRTAMASPTPSCLMARTSPAAKPAKTMTMRNGGGGDDAAAALQADGDGEVAVAGLVVHLLDAGEQEDLVVHREPEGEDEDEHRHPQVEGADGVEAEEPGEVSFLEDPDQGAEAGAEAEDVHDDGLDRHDDRAGHEEQQHEGGGDDHEGGQREAFAEPGLDVDELGGDAADLGVEGRLRAAKLGDELGCFGDPVRSRRA